jgi:CheY-like chemotaxis protein
VSVFTPDEEDTRQRRLPAPLAQAIDESLSALDRLTQEAARFAQPGDALPSGHGPDILIHDLDLPEVSGLDLIARVRASADRGLTLVILSEASAVTRTERRHDRYHLDLKVSLEDLDEYEVSNLTRVLTHHLPSLVAAARQQNSEERIIQLLRAIAPADPVGTVELRVAEMSADLRREFLEQVPLRTSAQVHERAGFPGGNPSQTVHRWRKQGKIFSVNHGGREWYPAFQFGEDGRPLPIIAELLEILHRDTERTDWDNALWFTGYSGWLDGKTPIDLLHSDPDSVKRAAEQEILRDEQ